MIQNHLSINNFDVDILKQIIPKGSYARQLHKQITS